MNHSVPLLDVSTAALEQLELAVDRHLRAVRLDERLRNELRNFTAACRSFRQHALLDQPTDEELLS